LDNHSTLEVSSAVDSDEAVENVLGRKTTDVVQHDVTIAHVPTLPPLDNQSTLEVSSAVDSNEADENVLGRKATDVVQGNDPNRNHDVSIAHVPTLPPLDNQSTLEVSSAVDSDEADENVLGRKATDVVQGNDPNRNHDVSIAHVPTLPPLDNHSTLEVSLAVDSDEAAENVLGRKATDVVQGNDPNRNHDISIAHVPTLPPLDNHSTLEVSSAVDSDEAAENVQGSKVMDVDRGNNPNHDVSTNAVTNATSTLTPKVRGVGGLKDRVEERKVIFIPIDVNAAL
jgi:hypothetical protein